MSPNFSNVTYVMSPNFSLISNVTFEMSEKFGLITYVTFETKMSHM